MNDAKTYFSANNTESNMVIAEAFSKIKKKLIVIIVNVWVANCLYYTIVFIYSAGLKFLGSAYFLQICINHGLLYTSTSWHKTSNVAVFLQRNWVGTISLPISELGIQYLLLSAWDLSAWLFLQRFGRAIQWYEIMDE